MSGYICVFDCETIPDSDSLRVAYGYDGDDESVAKMALKAQKEQSGSEFLPVCFHKVVTISAVIADEFGRFKRVSTIAGSSEKEKISEFIKFINDYNPRLISYNGRGFDLPMLMIRAMRYNLDASEYFNTNDRVNGKDKWCNYRSRYDGIFHLDLLDHISDFKAVSGLKLDLLCSSLNLPGKYDVCGDEVMSLYYNNKQDKIDEYCESDVLNTYWLFLKYELLRGKLNIDDYMDYLNLMSEYLKDKKPDMSYTPVFCQYIQNEFDRIKVD
ncbi:3'-5' exonuclease [Campylobacter lanienae]|uniref:3'-5' exonuclease n=1 Tax=Campylobacter lanienae TaxID=75658 RepID=UPI0015D8368D|nr:3'-5' exonuclease [Campylobacter lanienae]